MGAESVVESGDLRWLRPLPLWTGILAGPMAWACDLTASYASVKWVCHTSGSGVLLSITIGSLIVVLVGAAIAWTALMRTAGDAPTDGGHARQRARFMAVLGLASCALFALQILAGAIPQLVLDACQ